MNKIKIFMLVVALSFSLAICVSFVSYCRLSPLHQYETVQNQFAILNGLPCHHDGKEHFFEVFQNRILFASILNALCNISFLVDFQWYFLLRVVSAFFAFFAFFYLLIKVGKVNYKIAAAAMFLLAYEIIFTFNHPWEHPTDFLDLIFISSFLWAALNYRRLALFLLAILAATNRESSVFAGVIWFFLYGIDNKFKLKTIESVYATVTSVISYGVVLLIRYSHGVTSIRHQQTFAIWPHDFFAIKSFINYNLNNPLQASWPILMLAMSIPLILLLWSNRKLLSFQDKRLLASSLAIFFITLIFGCIDELRIFIPTIVIIVFVVAVAESKKRLFFD